MYNYLKPHLSENLIDIDNEGKISLYFCVDGCAPEEITMSSQEPSVLYHYCSLETFFKIINSGTFHLSSLFKTNDTSEVVWFLNQFDNYVKTLNIKNDSIKVQLYYLRRLFQINLLEAYSLSLSSLEDDLSQWRGYGDFCKGIAIGINPKLLMINRGLPQRYYEGLCQNLSSALIKINYDEDKQIELIKLIIDKLIAKEEILPNLSFALAKIAYTCKNKGWQSEKEWRILYTPFESGAPIHFCQDKYCVSNIKTKTKGGTIVKYCEIPILEGLISKIIIGATCSISIKEFKNKIKDKIKYYKTIEISKSSLTFR